MLRHELHRTAAAALARGDQRGHHGAPTRRWGKRRTIEILKFRGATHQKGEYPFTIDADDGVLIIPLSATELKQKSSVIRVSSGVPELDEMCGGGMYRDSIVLVSGA